MKKKPEQTIGDGGHTLREWAIFHVDSCYEASSDFDRDCMIKCVEVGYEAHGFNLSDELIKIKAENDILNDVIQQIKLASNESCDNDMAIKKIDEILYKQQQPPKQ